MEGKQSYKALFWNLLSFIAVFSFATIVSFDNCEGLEKYLIINTVLEYGAYFIFIIVILSTFILAIIKRYVPSRPAVLLLGLYVYYAIITLYNDGNIFRQVFFANITLILATDLIITNNNKQVLRHYIKWSNILILLNFISVIALMQQMGFKYYRNGVISYGVYLLAGKNGHILILLPMMCLNYILYKRTKKLRFLFLIIICVINSLLVGSATSIIMQIIWIIIVLIVERIREIRKFVLNWKFWTILLVGIFVFFIVKQGFKAFSSLFEMLFNKDMVSQNRSILYSLGLSKVKDHWLMGYGYFFSGKFNIDGYGSSHNFIIDCLLYGGAIALAWYVIIIIVTIKKAKRYFVDRDSFVMISVIIAFLIGGFVDGYQFYPTWALFNCICLFLMRWEKTSNLLEGIEKTKKSINIKLK